MNAMIGPSSGAGIFKAWAKLNLAFSVGGPEPAGTSKPGFHRIASWMACIDLFDEMRVERLNGGSGGAGGESRYVIAWASDAIRPTPIDWPLGRDLAVRAHKLLEAHTGKTLPVSMTLTKRIPVGGGLGGGSSDAAAMLLAVDHLFGLRIPAAQLAALGSTLGSDVAFFLDQHREHRGASASPPRPALVMGFGDEIERLPLVSADVLLVVPPFCCPTAGVYRAYDELLAGPEGIHANVPVQSHPTALVNEGLVCLLARRAIESGEIDPSMCFNALTAPAVHLEHRLAGIIESITAAVRMQAHLTGSGSCIFVIGGESEIARAQPGLMRAIAERSELAGCGVLKTRLI